jgi:hypothetical protein
MLPVTAAMVAASLCRDQCKLRIPGRPRIKDLMIPKAAGSDK